VPYFLKPPNESKMELVREKRQMTAQRLAMRLMRQQQALVYKEQRAVKLLELLSLGYTSEEIGRELCMSSRTVEALVLDLELMNGARNRAHLVRIAFETGTLKLKEKRQRLPQNSTAST
jgi:DNA-binding CsgD family transcriptional regulator